MPVRLIATVAVLPVLLLFGCGDGDDDGEAAGPTTANGGAAEVTTSTVSEAPAFEESEADAVIEYDLVEYRFVGPTSTDGPKVFFKAENTGTEDHELEVLDPAGEPIGEIEAMPPGAKGSLAVELEPGTYTLQCLVETADGRTHKDLGMVQDLDVS